MVKKGNILGQSHFAIKGKFFQDFDKYTQLANWTNISYQFPPSLGHAPLYHWCCPQQTYQACLKMRTMCKSEQAMSHSP